MILKLNTVRLTSHPCQNILVNKQSSYGLPVGSYPISFQVVSTSILKTVSLCVFKGLSL